MQPIMIIADMESKKQIALSRGMKLAQQLDTPVEVVGFVYEYLQELSPDLRKRVKAEVLEKKKEWLDAEIAKQAPKGLSVRSKVVWAKSIHTWVLDACKKKDYFAVIKTAHRSGNFLYTSTDWHFLRECDAPVLIEAEKKWNKSRPIVASLDLETSVKEKQALNDRIMSHAVDVANAIGADLHVICAISIPTLLRDMDIIDVDEHMMKRRKQLKPVIDGLCEDYGLSRKQVHLKSGPPRKVIPSLANKLKADLVVMGTVGRRGFKGKLLGNTAEQVLQLLRTDVLAIK